MNMVKTVAYALATLGAFNWGLWALADIDLVDALFGSFGAAATLVYLLVGLSGLYVAYDYFVGGQTKVAKISRQE